MDPPVTTEARSSLAGDSKEGTYTEERGNQALDIDPTNEVQGTKLLLIFLAICLCTFLVGLDFNLIATAVPVITTEFDSLRDVGWYGAGFMVALCTSQPLAGKIFTLFNKKTVYLTYVLVFELGSLVCALSPSSRALIAGRVVTGLGASGIFAGGFVILTTIIPMHKRAIWTGSMGGVFAIASVVGPVLGGALTHHLTWRWCFYINLPIGGAGAVIFVLLTHLRPAEMEKMPLRKKLESLDGVGFALLAGSLTMLLLALQWGGVAYAWSSSVVVGLLVGAALTFVLCVRWQLRRQDAALVPPRLFTVNRNPALLCAAGFFINGPFQTIIYWLPIWFQGVRGVSPTTSGVDYFPTVIADVFAAFLGAGLVTKLGWWNPFLLFAEAMVCLGGGLLTTLYPDISDGHWIGYQIFGGIGYSLASNMSHVAMQASLPQELIPLGTSTFLLTVSTSCAIFMAIGQAVFQHQLQVNLIKVVPEQVVTNVINAGATNLAAVVPPGLLPSVVQEYSRSITQVFYIPAASPVISFALIACCKWISTKSKQSPAKTRDTKTDTEGNHSV